MQHLSKLPSIENEIKYFRQVKDKTRRNNQIDIFDLKKSYLKDTSGTN